MKCCIVSSPPQNISLPPISPEAFKSGDLRAVVHIGRQGLSQRRIPVISQQPHTGNLTLTLYYFMDHRVETPYSYRIKRGIEEEIAFEVEGQRGSSRQHHLHISGLNPNTPITLTLECERDKEGNTILITLKD